jgi:hypothetical protein
MTFLLRRAFVTAAAAAAASTSTIPAAAAAATSASTAASNFSSRVTTQAYINSVTLVGNVGADPELRQLSDNVTKVSFPMVTSAGSKPEWHRVAFYNNPVLQQYADSNIVKGALVMVRGHIQYRKYEVNGEAKSYTEIIASRKREGRV